MLPALGMSSGWAYGWWCNALVRRTALVLCHVQQLVPAEEMVLVVAATKVRVLVNPEYHEHEQFMGKCAEQNTASRAQTQAIEFKAIKLQQKQ
jgi:hypothetical protein